MLKIITKNLIKDELIDLVELKEPIDDLINNGPILYGYSMKIYKLCLKLSFIIGKEKKSFYCNNIIDKMKKVNKNQV